MSEAEFWKGQALALAKLYADLLARSRHLVEPESDKKPVPAMALEHDVGSVLRPKPAPAPTTEQPPGQDTPAQKPPTQGVLPGGIDAFVPMGAARSIIPHKDPLFQQFVMEKKGMLQSDVMDAAVLAAVYLRDNPNAIREFSEWLNANRR